MYQGPYVRRRMTVHDPRLGISAKRPRDSIRARAREESIALMRFRGKFASGSQSWITERREFTVEALRIEHCVARRYGGEHAPPRHFLCRSFGMHRERRHADRRCSRDKREAARRRDADTDAGERSRPDRDNNPVEIGDGDARLGHYRCNHREKPLLMRPADHFGAKHRAAVAGVDTDRAGFEGRIEGEQFHGRPIPGRTQLVDEIGLAPAQSTG